MRDQAFLFFGLWRCREKFDALLNLLPEAERDRRRAHLAGLESSSHESARDKLAELMEEEKQSARARLCNRFGDPAARLEPRVAALLARFS